MPDIAFCSLVSTLLLDGCPSGFAMIIALESKVVAPLMVSLLCCMDVCNCVTVCSSVLRTWLLRLYVAMSVCECVFYLASSIIIIIYTSCIFVFCACVRPGFFQVYIRQYTSVLWMNSFPGVGWH